MKANENKKASVSEPLIRELIARQLVQSQLVLKNVVVGSQPLAPANLYQDAGGGYNANFTFPQD